MRIEIDGFSLGNICFDKNSYLTSFDLTFSQFNVGHFVVLKPKSASFTNHDFSDLKHNVPDWVVTMLDDYYHDVYWMNRRPDETLTLGFKALIRNLFEFFDVVMTGHSDPNIKYLCYGFKNRDQLVYLLSDHSIYFNSIDETRMRNSFSHLTGGDFMGDYSVGEDKIYINDLKIVVAFSLKFTRLSLNLTLADVVSLANKKGIQITTASLSRFENNLRHPDFETLAGLFNILNITDMNGFLEYFTDDILVKLYDEEFNNFDFEPVDLNDAIPNNIPLSKNEYTLLSYLFVTFWGYLIDYKDIVWINVNELPINQWININELDSTLNSLVALGFIKTRLIKDNSYIYLNLDAFIEDVALAKIKSLRDDFVSKYGTTLQDIADKFKINSLN